MIKRIKDWYVFRVYNRADLAKSVVILFLFFLIAFISMNFCKSEGIEADRWIWGFAFVVMLGIIINILLNIVFGGRLQINPGCGQPGIRRCFVALDRISGKKVFEKKGDYAIFKPRENQVLLTLMIPEIDGDREPDSGTIERLIGEIEVDCDDFEKTLDFGLWFFFCDQYDVDEIAEFIFENLRSTGQVCGYESSILQALANRSTGWMREAEDIVYESHRKLFEDAGVNNPLSDVRIIDEIVKVFLQIANKRFAPALLLNIARFEIRRLDDEESASAADGEERVEVPQKK
jgi:hypothetical protein